ncbi:MAG TPA: DMT family transporter [Anaeromyxobacter sp.]
MADAGSPSARRKRAEAYLALAFLALFWGYSWVAVKIATRDASPFAVAALRAGLGAVALFAFLAATRRPLRPTPFVPTLVYGLLQTAGFTLAQTAAVSVSGAGKVAVLAYTMPFWLALLAWPLLGERLAGPRWVALALAGAGLGLVVTPLDRASMTGNVLGVSAGLVWAVSAVWVVRLRKAGAYDILSLTAWQMVWGAAALAAVALAAPWHVRWTAPFVASIAFLAVVATALGWALWLFVLARLPASVAGVASLATPVVGVLAAAVQLHETPTPRELMGIACIVVALVVNARGGPRVR